MSALDWKAMETAERTICGRYTIASVTTNGVTTWEAWRVVPGGAWFAPLEMGLPDRESARAAAQADADAR